MRVGKHHSLHRIGGGSDALEMSGVGWPGVHYPSTDDPRVRPLKGHRGRIRGDDKLDSREGFLHVFHRKEGH
jgi:hypothetical protein